jgi:hypothetical protein
MADHAGLPAVRAGLLCPQEFALLGRRYFQRPFGQATRRSTRDLFHLCEIDIESRPLLTEGLLDDNFPPLFGESHDRLQFFGRQLPCCHSSAILEVREIRQGEFLSAHPTLITLRRKGGPALINRASLNPILT